MTSSKPRRRHATIADIAKLAGVAPMTVSRVINCSEAVSDALRMRVDEAIRALDYSPNRLARSLKTQRTNLVGVLLPDVANPFSGELAQGIQSVLLEHGFSFFVATTDRSADRETDAMQAFFDHRADGIIVATRSSAKGDEILARFAGRGYPIVLVGREPAGPGLDRVTCHFRQGGLMAVEHLISLGHKRIGFLGLNYPNRHRLERCVGYMEALEQHGIELNPEYVVGPDSENSPGFSTHVDGYEGMSRLIALPVRPTAVFARNDFTAFGAIRAINDAGLRVPHDISIVGFDDVPLAGFTAPPLTTIEQPIAKQGARAAELLIERIRHRGTIEAREEHFDCRLIVRQSTAPLTQSQTA